MNLFSLPLTLSARASLTATGRGGVPAALSTRNPRVADEEGGYAEGGASIASLRELRHLRAIAMGGQAVAIAVGYASDLSLPYGAMLAVLGLVWLFNLLMGRRLHQRRPATHVEVFANLMADLAAFTVMLLLAGGATNPFALLYLLHVALIGLLLPRGLAVAGTLVALIGFALAAEFASPLRLLDGREVAQALLTAGRFTSFAVTAVMIAAFVSRVSGAVRIQQMLLEEAARKAVNDEVLMRMGTIATGAAHELGGPLMSMGILVQEWQRNGRIDEFERDVGLLSSQLGACKDALANLRSAARALRLDDAPVQPCDAFVRDVVQRFRATRPDIPVRCVIDESTAAPAIRCDAGLKQSLLILLNNAADACSREIGIHAAWNLDEIEFTVVDDGSGIPAARLRDLGRAFFSTKEPGKGNGLGVMLAAATAARLGGSIEWTNAKERGAIARIRLPRSTLQPTHK